MKLSNESTFMKFFIRGMTFGVMLVAFTLSFAPARAAELVMFEQAGCAWCKIFDREIAPVYGKTTEGMRAPLRRVNIDEARPSDLDFIEAERLTPLFVLIDKGREIGRIRGYPGEDHFWGLLAKLIEKLDVPGTGKESARLLQNIARAAD